MAGLCLLAAGLVLTADVEISRYCLLQKLPGDVRAFLRVSELYAHGAGIVLVALSVAALDPFGRIRFGSILAVGFGAGGLALVGKLLVGRRRPKAFDFAGDVQETFAGWFPAWSNADMSDVMNRTIQSFPSGHSASAVAMAAVMSHFYPRGRWLFGGIAVMVMLQRVVSGAHFPSDTLVGAAVGLLAAIICLDRRLLGRFLNRPVSSLNP